MGVSDFDKEKRSRRAPWVRKLERIGWKLALRHDFMGATVVEGEHKNVNRLYNFVAPIYDAFFGRLEGFRTGASRLVEKVVKPGDRVLDLGAGTGMNVVPLQGVASRITALDLNLVMIRKARKSAARKGWSGSFLQGNALELPFQEASFDAVLAAYVLVYFTREQCIACLKGVHRVLGEDGSMGIVCGQGECSPRNPRREEWLEMLDEAGFTSVEFDDFFEVIRIVHARK